MGTDTSAVKTYRVVDYTSWYRLYTNNKTVGIFAGDENWLYPIQDSIWHYLTDKELDDILNPTQEELDYLELTRGQELVDTYVESLPYFKQYFEEHGNK